jgi:hypothetical protein
MAVAAEVMAAAVMAAEVMAAATEVAAAMTAEVAMTMILPPDDRGRDAHEKFVTAWPASEAALQEAKQPYGRRQ